MARIPTPLTMTTQQILQKLQQVSGNIYNSPQQQAILDAHVNMEQEKRKQMFLTIENIDKIKGHKYSEWLTVIGVKEWDNHYEFTLADGDGSQIEEILLHRRQTSDKRYIIEYNNQTLWVSKDRLSTIAGVIECMREI
jgi:hypothetical protein